MKAEELRIGNYLKFKNTQDLAIVELIHKKHFDCRDEKGYFTPNGNYEPIPLTEAWLIKFGFAYDEQEHNYSIDLEKDWSILALDADDFSATIYDRLTTLEEGKDACLNGEITIYVHQLQNLYFALTGEELTI